MKNQLTARHIFGLSALILVPCFWQQRIQSSDLSSHIYNAWLASLVERSELPGLYIADQWTNVLFDWMLLHTLVWFGPDWAQRISVSIAVLVFFWGATAAIRAIGRRSPPHVLAILAIFTYGFVFRMGFFNFYLGMGFALGALALLWRKPSSSRVWAVPLLGLAYLSHILAVAWLLPVAAYLWTGKSLRPRRRLALFGAAAAIIVCASLYAIFELPSAWRPNQALYTTGADQAFIYGDEYKIVLVGIIILQITLLNRWIDRIGLLRLALSLPFQVAFLQAMALALFPTKIELPGFGAPFSLFTDRVGLAQSVIALGFLANAPTHRFHKPAAAGLLAVFLSLSFRDSLRLTAMETQLQSMVRALPSRSRVISGLCYPGRINAAYHLIDRACIGHCFSYGNYEPASGHFRLRARPDNRFVISDYLSANQIEYEIYRFEDRDLPLHLFDNPSGGIRSSKVVRGQLSQRACPESPPSSFFRK